MIGNLLRLGVIALAEEYLQWDMASGWVHTVLGLFMFVLISLCLAATGFAIQSPRSPHPREQRITQPDITIFFDRCYLAPVYRTRDLGYYERPTGYRLSGRR